MSMTFGRRLEQFWFCTVLQYTNEYKILKLTQVKGDKND
jgi:hypothetical protein